MGQPDCPSNRGEIIDMSPAFTSVRQMVSFIVLLITTMALPAVMAKTNLLDRRNVYSSIAWKYGSFPWIEQQIFSDTSDVDIAFIGNSHIWTAIDTPYVQEKLGDHLGHQASVITLGWPWPGFDAVYTIARDLMDHRHVKMLVITDEGVRESPHLHSSKWFRIGENSESLNGLPTYDQAQYYAGAILGMPRHLLSLIRPNLLEDPAHCQINFWNTYYHAPNLAQNQGSLRARIGYGVTPDFSEFVPESLTTSDDVVIYSEETASQFKFTNKSTAFQIHFAQKLAGLCQNRGTQLVVLHTPRVHEREGSVITEIWNWPEVLKRPVNIVGVPPDKFFADLDLNDAKKLFYETNHLNQNGQTFFTKLITPTLLKLYDSPTEPR